MKSVDDYLTYLNEQRFTPDQQRAIVTSNKNVQIIACAGSGKTSTIVARIIFLVVSGVKPSEIVAITYTEKAAASLKQKIYQEYEKAMGTLEGLSDLYVGTIHGYCLFMLQEFTSDFKNFDILNEIQVKLHIKAKRWNNGLNDCMYYVKNNPNPKPLVGKSRSNWEQFSDRVTSYKQFLDIAREYGVEKFGNPHLEELVRKYSESLLADKYFDFTSIQITALEYFKNQCFDEYISGIKHLIIDEYQDVNEAQEEIIQYFYNHGTTICVVGDDDQTIYEWRGSRLKYIKDFTERYNNVEFVELSKNFRSSEGITSTAETLISNNNKRLSKKMESANNQEYAKGDILGIRFDTREEENQFIIDKINQLVSNKFEQKSKGKEWGLGYDDIVILVSSVRKIDSLITKLNDSKIPFIVEGTQNLFETPEIIAIIETFEKMIFNNLTSLKNQAGNAEVIKRSFPKAPHEVIERWQAVLSAEEESINDALINFRNLFLDSVINPNKGYEYTIQDNLHKLLFGLGAMSAKLDDKVYYNIGKFTEMINDFEKIFLKTFPLERLIKFQEFLIQDAKNMYPEGWLSPKFNLIKTLRVMTYHQAKGLEFPVVFLPFLTKDSTFPLTRGGGGITAWSIIHDEKVKQEYNDKESHHRVFYVGMTRAEKYLFMTRSPGTSKTGLTSFTKEAIQFTQTVNSEYVVPSTCLEIKYDKSPIPKYSTDEVITLNFSLLRDLFECGYKFKLSNVFGFRGPLDIRMGYGQSIHSMLDYIHKNWQSLNLDDDGEIWKIVNRFIHLPYASVKLIDAEKRKAFDKIRAYIINNKSRFKNILFSEKRIDYKFSEYFFIDGKIDLIRDDVNKELTIVDFKSDKSVLSQEQIKNQLMLYVLGYESMKKEKITYIESYDVNETKPTRIPITDFDRDEFKKQLSKHENTIKTGNYQRHCDIDPDHKNKHCKGCFLWNDKLQTCNGKLNNKEGI